MLLWAVIVGMGILYYLSKIASRLYAILLTLKRIENKWWPPTKVPADRKPEDFKLLS